MIATSVLVWFFVTILMMAFFAGIEMAFFSVNRLIIELKRKQGKPGAQILSRFIQSPETFVGTTLIGYTLFLVCFILLLNAVTSPLWNFLKIPYDSVRLLLDIALATFAGPQPFFIIAPGMGGQYFLPGIAAYCLCFYWPVQLDIAVCI
jgi:CBS domain containing-hemolysin-like protein